MIELGLLSGDPLAADEWSSEQRVAGLAWWIARTRSAPSAWAFSAPDLRMVVQQFVGMFPRLLSWLQGAK